MARQPENVTPAGKRWPARLFAARAAKLLARGVGVGVIVAVVYVALQLPFFQTNASQSPGDNNPRIGLVEPNVHVNPLDTLEQTTPDATGSGDGGPDDAPGQLLTFQSTTGATVAVTSTPPPEITRRITATPTPTETLEPPTPTEEPPTLTPTDEPTETPTPRPNETSTEVPAPLFDTETVRTTCVEYFENNPYLGTGQNYIVLGLDASNPSSPHCTRIYNIATEGTNFKPPHLGEPTTLEEWDRRVIYVKTELYDGDMQLAISNQNAGQVEVLDGSFFSHKDVGNGWTILRFENIIGLKEKLRGSMGGRIKYLLFRPPGEISHSSFLIRINGVDQ